MENTANWNATQKKISLSLRIVNSNKGSLEERRKLAVATTIVTLKANGLLKPTEHDLEDVINKVIDSWRDSARQGKCGLTLTSTIYNKLVELGCLK